MAKKNKLIYQNIESLQPIVNIVNDASLALNDKSRTIRESAIPEVVMGALGAGVGGTASFIALYGLGTVGLSGAGIMSGLAAAGGAVSTVLGGVVSASVAGIFVLATPVVVLGAGGVGLASHLKNKQLKQEKERLYKEALKKHQAIIDELKQSANESKERLDYLQRLNTLLQKVLEDLEKDMEVSTEG